MAYLLVTKQCIIILYMVVEKKIETYSFFFFCFYVNHKYKKKNQKLTFQAVIVLSALIIVANYTTVAFLQTTSYIGTRYCYVIGFSQSISQYLHVGIIIIVELGCLPLLHVMFSFSRAHIILQIKL